MGELWRSLQAGLGYLLTFLHDAFVPLTGEFAWGWGIIGLTLLVRLVLLPLAIKQITSMRGMQQLAPELKKLQAKYKVDAATRKADPAKYQEQRQKLQQEQMALYRDNGVNPAAGCLPLLAQAPVFFALFSVLRSPDIVPELQDAPWYLVDALSQTVQGGAGVGAYLLLLIMGISTFVSQRQTMASNPAAASQPQQKVMLYVLPGMLVFFGINLPIGVLLYWVTTNLWTMVQQYVIYKRIQAAEGGGAEVPSAQQAAKPAKAVEAKGTRRDSAGTRGRPAGSTGNDSGASVAGAKAGAAKAGAKAAASSEGEGMLQGFLRRRSEENGHDDRRRAPGEPKGKPTPKRSQTRSTRGR